MKRNWEGNEGPNFDLKANSDQSAWGHLSAHPYASAYTSMGNPFSQGKETSFEDQYAREPEVKKSRQSESRTDPQANGSQDSEGDDDDEDDDEDDDGPEDPRPSKGAAANRGKGKNAKGANGKTKVKLTRGSR